MIRPDPEKWGQTVASLREQSMQADHPRTRERFLAMYMIGTRQTNATRWAAEIGRDPETVMSWVHAYNAEGPAALRYERTGGRTPLFCAETVSEIARQVEESSPSDHGLLGYGWTLKKLQHWVGEQLGRLVSRNTLRTLLKQAGLSWKKCKKVLRKANAATRAIYVARFQRLFDQMCREELILLFIDEAHFHRRAYASYLGADEAS